MKIVRKVALIGSIAFALAACGGGGDSASSSSAKVPTRTVLMYMVGSDLETDDAAATADLNEMMQVGSDANLNIVVETGGSNKDGWRTVQRHLIKAGSKQTLADLGDKNMGESATLQEFIDWGMRTYPADSYTLLFWDHGNGAVGPGGVSGTVGFDQNHNNDALSLQEISASLQNVTTINQKKFDIIGFDTCLMATLEAAKSIAPYAEYMVASEESEPGSGWNYAAWLGAIKSTPGLSSLEISKTIVDSYFASFAPNDPNGKEITLSVISLNKVASVNNSLGLLAGLLDSNLLSSPDIVRIDVGTSRSKSEEYGTKTDVGMVDLSDFLSRLPASYASEVNGVKSALNSAVVYSRNSVLRPNAKGLSIYLPSQKTINDTNRLQQSLVTYKSIDFNTNWQTLVEHYSLAAAADKTKPLLSNEQQVGNNLSVNIGSQDINSVRVYVARNNGDGTLLILSNEQPDSVDKGVATFGFSNQVLTVGGHYVFTRVLDLNEDNPLYDLYTLGVPALVDGNLSTLLIAGRVNNDETVNLDVLGYLTEASIGAPRLMPLLAGDIVAPIFYSLNMVTGALDPIQDTNLITVPSSGLQASVGLLPTGNYAAFFVAEDFSGNTANSSVFGLTVN